MSETWACMRCSKDVEISDEAVQRISRMQADGPLCWLHYCDDCDAAIAEEKRREKLPWKHVHCQNCGHDFALLGYHVEYDAERPHCVKCGQLASWRKD